MRPLGVSVRALAVAVAGMMALAASLMAAPIAQATDPEPRMIDIAGTIMLVPGEDEEQPDRPPDTVVLTDSGLYLHVSAAGFEDAAPGDRFSGAVVVADELWNMGLEGSRSDQVDDVGEEDVDLHDPDFQDSATQDFDFEHAQSAAQQDDDYLLLETAQDRGTILDVVDVEFHPEQEDEEESAATDAVPGRTHAISVVWVGSSKTARPKEAGLRDLVKKAGDYWVGQAAGLIGGFKVNSVSFVNTTKNVCSYSMAWAEARKALGPKAPTSANGGHMIVVVPQSLCAQQTVIGVGSLGRDASMGGSIWLLADAADPAKSWGELAHELGHNIGLGHSNSLQCPMPRVDAPGLRSKWSKSWGCTSATYGDWYDVMGQGLRFNEGPLAELNIAHKIRLGVVKAGSTVRKIVRTDGLEQTITLSGTSNRKGIQGLEIIDPLTGESLFVEYRDGVGSEAKTYYAAVNQSSAQSAVGPGVRFMRQSPVDAYNFQVDVTVSKRERPGYSPALWYGQGQVFYSYSKGPNGKSGISVTVTSLKDNVASVKVSLNDGLAIFTKAATPTIKGSVKLGTKVSVAGESAASWQPTAEKVTYQWLREGKPISGATAASYTVGKADCSKNLSVKVTASKARYSPISATSKATKATCPVPLAAFTGVAKPTIKGSVKQGAKVTVAGAATSSWKPAATKVTYQWLRQGKPIPQATAASYTVVADDCGKPLSVKVTATRDGYTTSSATSSATTTFCRTVNRLGQKDRYATAVQISTHSYPSAAKVSTLYVATGTSFPDALAAAPAAAVAGSPMLLVPTKGTVSPSVIAELKRLAPSRIIVIGGKSAIGDSVVKQLQAAAGKKTIVQRIGGTDRYSTANLIVADAFPKTVGEVFIATGSDFPDALAASAAAGGRKVPVILTDGNAKDLNSSASAALKRLKPQKVYIVGGTGAVSASIAKQLEKSYTVERLSGANRYETSAVIAAKMFTMSNKSPMVTTHYWATGVEFPDALAGAPAAARVGVPLYVVPPTCVPKSILTHLEAKKTTTVYLLGGKNALSESVRALKPC